MTIKELAELIAKTVGFTGKITFDSSKLDGPPRKLVESSCLASLGWEPLVSMEEGLKKTYVDFCAA